MGPTERGREAQDLVTWMIINVPGGVRTIHRETHVAESTIKKWRRGEFPQERHSGKIDDVHRWAVKKFGRRYPPEGFPEGGLPTLIDEAIRRENSHGAPAGDTPETANVPRQLPAVVAGFVGREAQLTELDRMVTEQQQELGPVLVALHGEPGCGKTALAVFWAHHLCDRYPDGQLYADLQGYAPGEPSRPEFVLTRFLDALGEPGPADNSDVEALSAQFRTATAGKRILVVLDNARDSEHVRPLLPGATTGAVVVTSRNDLAGLAASHGAFRLRLGGLTPSESLELLSQLLGSRDRLTMTMTMTRLAELCAGLPLPLRIAAVRIGSHGDDEFAALVTELEESSALDALETGADARTAIRSVLSWSYRALTDGEKQTLRVFGLFPGTTLDEDAAAAMTSATRRAARRALDGLVAANLLTKDDSGRLVAHDFVRTWAAELAETGDEASAGSHALARLINHYLTQLSRSDTDAVLAWTRTHYDNLLAATTFLATHAWHTHLLALAGALTEHIAVVGLPGQIATMHEDAIVAATALGDDIALAAAHLALGVLRWRVSNYSGAEEHFTTAHRISRELGDTTGEGRALTGLGSTYHYQGRLTEALTVLTEAEELLQDGPNLIAYGTVLGATASVHHALGDVASSITYLERATSVFHDNDTVREGRALGNLGVDYYTLGMHDKARECHRRALEIHQTRGDRAGAGRAHLGLARLDDDAGQYATALEHLVAARRLFDEIEDQDGAASALVVLGEHHRRQGHRDQALVIGLMACAFADKVGEREAQSEAHNTLGETLLARGIHSGARHQHRIALDISTTSRNLLEQARAHAGIAAAALETDPALAATHTTAANEIRNRLTLPNIDQPLTQENGPTK